MIEEISIKNLGTIEDTTINFTPGLNVITGETGTGKTMIINSLKLLLGQRANSGHIGSHNDKTEIQGIFTIEESSDTLKNDEQENKTITQIIEETGATLETIDMPQETDNSHNTIKELYINRTISNNGKNRAVIGGKTIPTKTLQEISQQIIQIHGQNEQQKLTDPQSQLKLIDNQTGQKGQKLIKEYKKAYNNYKTTRKLHQEITTNNTTKKQELEELQQLIKEHEKLNPQINEENTLEQEINKIKNQLKNTETIQQAYNQLTNNNDEENYYPTTNIQETISNITTQLNKIKTPQNNNQKEIENNYTTQEEINQITILAENIEQNLYELETYMENHLKNPETENLIETLQEKQERHNQIKKLLKQHTTTNTTEELQQKITQSTTTIKKLQKYTTPKETLEKNLKTAKTQLKTAAQNLTQQRNNTIKTLQEKINQELKNLDMKNTTITITNTTSKATPTGTDNITINIQQPGTKPTPIEKAASGGELSRIMLAIEITTQTNNNKNTTYIYDEIDAGIGGETANTIGNRLKQLSQTNQIILITHSPQIASKTTNHIKTQKTTKNNTNTTTTTTLTKTQQTQEIARMLSGHPNSPTAQQHAKELLNQTQKTLQ